MSHANNAISAIPAYKSDMPELLAPAGDHASLKTAAENGADAVYFGTKFMNMRDTAGNFELSELKNVVDFLHTRQMKGYLTLNTIVYNSELPKVRQVLETAKSAGIDAVICWDTAVISMAKELGIPIHLSTQASVSNIEALKFYANIGVSRVVLARECSLTDIREIHDAAIAEGINCEIEVFVHGAMCVSESGRCFMSTSAFKKSANRGRCIQPCRRLYKITDVEDSENSYILGEDYLLSPKDLCMIDHLWELRDAGVSAFKIEGRSRSADYVKATVSCYRKAIDAYANGTLTPDMLSNFKAELSDTYNRGFSEGFYFGLKDDWISPGPQSRLKKVFCGEVVNYYNKIGVAEFLIRAGTLKLGDRILVYGKNTPAGYSDVGEIQVEHEPVESVSRGERCGIKLPFTVRPKDKLFIIRENSSENSS